MNNVPPSVQPEFRQCFKCNFEAVTDQTNCPRCKKKVFFTSGNIRKRGIVLVVCGLFISGLIGAIAIGVGVMLWGQMKDPRSAQKIIDEQFALYMIFGLFAMLIVLGLHFALTGGWMIAFGKRNKILVWIMLAFVFIVIFAASFLTAFLP